MEIEELHSFTETRLDELIVLMKELDSEIFISPDVLKDMVGSSGSHLFAVMDDSHIIGCGTHCMCYSPTGKKAHIEDVVVLSSYHGQHLGKELVNYMIDYARKELVNVGLYLTSFPHRIAANRLYKVVGFRQKETNVYKMGIRDSEIYYK